MVFIDPQEIRDFLFGDFSLGKIKEVVFEIA